MTINSQSTQFITQTQSPNKTHQKHTELPEGFKQTNKYSLDTSTTIGKFHAIFGNTDTIDEDPLLTQNMMDYLANMPKNEYQYLEAHIAIDFSIPLTSDNMIDAIMEADKYHPRFSSSQDAKKYFNNQISDLKQENDEFGISRDNEIGI